MPACSISFGYILIGVWPGRVFISLSRAVPSGQRKKSQRESPAQPIAL